MEIFSPLLQGSYAYLIIFQILVVTALFLLFLWLVVQRSRAAATAAVTTASIEIVPTTEHTELIEKKRVLEDENQRLKATTNEMRPLLEKVKFLESKLLEYEILQEEIGTLGTLKVENEKLKEHLVRVESELNAVTKARPRVDTQEKVPHEISDPLSLSEENIHTEIDDVAAMIDRIEKPR